MRRPILLLSLAVIACSSEPGDHVGSSVDPLVQAPQGDAAVAADAGADARAESASSASPDVCERIQDHMGNCPDKFPMKISCGPGAAVPRACQTSGEDYFSTPISTWCCPGGTSLDVLASTDSTCVRECGENKKCNCTGNMYIADYQATALENARVYVDWWGWGSPPNDPSGEIPRWETFLQNIGGSRWLGAVTGYWNPLTGGMIGNPTNLWASEWSGSTVPLPASQWPCTQNYECPVTDCDIAAGHCYCASDSDCASNHCKQSTGLCYPSHDELQPEVDAAVAHFNPVDDAIILIALPPAVPWPNYMNHTSFARSGHPGIAVAEAAYNPTQTAGLEHEIAEAMTNPYSYSSGHTAWVGPCGCEVADRCSPPPPGSLAHDTLQVGVTPDPGERDTVAAMWDNDRNNYAGECVNAQITSQQYFYNSGGDLYEEAGSNFLDLGHYGAYGIAGRVGAASWGHLRVDVFGIGGQYHHIQHMYWAPGAYPSWNDWGALPSPYTAIFSPDAFSWRPGRIDVVVVGNSVLVGARHVFHRYYENGTFYGWTDLGAPPGITIESRPAAAAWNVNRFDVFVLSNESPPHVRHGYSTNGSTMATWSSDWGYPPGVTLVDLDAASRGDGRVEVFAVSTAGDLWQRDWVVNHWDDWSNWGQPGGDPLLTVGAVSQGDGFVDTVSKGSSAHYAKWWNGTWSPWYQDTLPPAQAIGPDISAW